MELVWRQPQESNSIEKNTGTKIQHCWKRSYPKLVIGAAVWEFFPDHKKAAAFAWKERRAEFSRLCREAVPLFRKKRPGVRRTNGKRLLGRWGQNKSCPEKLMGTGRTWFGGG